MKTLAKSLSVLSAVAVLALSLAGRAESAQATGEMDGGHSFDFEFGEWKAHLSRRLKPLTGSTTWVEYDGTSIVRPIWNGAANLGELEIDGPAGHIEGLSLRVYNRATHQWGISYANSAAGAVGLPMIGGFKDGRGEFYAQDSLNDRMIFVRFVFSDITTHTFQLEQAFSGDGGKSWEPNWIARFSR